MNRVLFLAALGALSLGCDLVTTLPGKPPVMIVAEDPVLSVNRPTTPPIAVPASAPPSTAAPSSTPAPPAKKP